jgi:hypothetical protein
MTADRSAATAEEFAARVAPFDAAPAAFVETTVDQLDRSHFGLCVSIPDRAAVGYLYAVHDDFNDGYPSRLIVLVDDDGDAIDEVFTDSDPAQYPKTMRTRCLVEAIDAMRPAPDAPRADEGAVAEARDLLARLEQLDLECREATADAEREKAGMREVALFRAANAKAVMGGYAIRLARQLVAALDAS